MCVWCKHLLSLANDLTEVHFGAHWSDIIMTLKKLHVV